MRLIIRAIKYLQIISTIVSNFIILIQFKIGEADSQTKPEYRMSFKDRHVFNKSEFLMILFMIEW